MTRAISACATPMPVSLTNSAILARGVVKTGFHINPLTVGREFDHVGHQVQDDLAQHPGIGANGWHIVDRIQFDRQSGFGCLVRHHPQANIDRFAQVDLFQIGFELTGLDLLQLEDIVDEF